LRVRLGFDRIPLNNILNNNHSAPPKDEPSWSIGNPVLARRM
jgi:hypothetical protein